ncbi:hypothetical protein KCP77_16400 [Salmonella enterica subsp. enterica]|nr:hypothetical protein KCP77_16400 [Salmonella enterica subsp. enterica]
MYHPGSGHYASSLRTAAKISWRRAHSLFAYRRWRPLRWRQAGKLELFGFTVPVFLTPHSTQNIKPHHEMPGRGLSLASRLPCMQQRVALKYWHAVKDDIRDVTLQR